MKIIRDYSEREQKKKVEAMKQVAALAIFAPGLLPLIVGYPTPEGYEGLKQSSFSAVDTEGTWPSSRDPKARRCK